MCIPKQKEARKNTKESDRPLLARQTHCRIAFGSTGSFKQNTPLNRPHSTPPCSTYSHELPPYDRHGLCVLWERVLLSCSERLVHQEEYLRQASPKRVRDDTRLLGCRSIHWISRKCHWGDCGWWQKRRPPCSKGERIYRPDVSVSYEANHETILDKTPADSGRNWHEVNSWWPHLPHSTIAHPKTKWVVCTLRIVYQRKNISAGWKTLELYSPTGTERLLLTSQESPISLYLSDSKRHAKHNKLSRWILLTSEGQSTDT